MERNNTQGPAGGSLARVLAIFFLLGSAAASDAAMRHAPDAKLAAKIDSYIRPFAESNNFPGAILVALRP